MGATTPEQIVELLDSAFHARDASAIAEFYEDDAIFANPPMWTAVGRAEIIERLNELFEATDALDVAYNFPAKCVVVGDYAFTHYTSVTTVSLPDGVSQEIQIRTTTVAHRGSDGNWRYSIDHNSSQ
jgi:uncharacterized protein (TIGR02246 family)